MKTGSLKTSRASGRIAISYSARGFHGPSYKALAPGGWFRSVSKPEYDRRFGAQLAALDPQKVWDDLHKLVHPHEPIILCHEVPPFTESNWCHRRIVAEWLERELGVEVREEFERVRPSKARQIRFAWKGW